METITRRRTDAAQTGVQKPPGAASSVFDAARQAKPKRVTLPPIDLATVEIKTGVPITTLRRGAGAVSPYTQLLERMKPGDCVTLPTIRANALVARAKKLDIKVAKRIHDAKSHTVWRVE
jgi:hypothetical protein